MKKSRFLALLQRMKYIQRWGLMRNTSSENVLEHTANVAVIAHALAVIAVRLHGQNVDPGAVVIAALYHDMSEILTGDMPTPVKYKTSELQNAYKMQEREAKNRLFSLLPAELREDYRPGLYAEESSPEIYSYVKAADRLAAYLKCVEECRTGNLDYRKAEAALKADVGRLSDELPWVKTFTEVFLPGYLLTLDEM